MLELNRSTVVVGKTKPMASTKPSHLDLANSIGVGSFIVTVLFVIITPPFLLKIPVLILGFWGLFYFSRKSHWTHKWPTWAQYGSASVAVLILSSIAIPQLITQWKAEHPRPATVHSSASAPLPVSVPVNATPGCTPVPWKLVGPPGKQALTDKLAQQYEKTHSDESLQATLDWVNRQLAKKHLGIARWVPEQTAGIVGENNGHSVISGVYVEGFDEGIKNCNTPLVEIKNSTIKH
jgi:hypothetical protein